MRSKMPLNLQFVNFKKNTIIFEILAHSTNFVKVFIGNKHLFSPSTARYTTIINFKFRITWGMMVIYYSLRDNVPGH